jgi:hypothetical protein
MPTELSGIIPTSYQLYGSLAGNRVEQILSPQLEDNFRVERLVRRGVPRFVLTSGDHKRIFVVDRQTSNPQGDSMIRVKRGSLPSVEQWPIQPDLTHPPRWLNPSAVDPVSLSDDELDRRTDRLRQSWSGQIKLVAERHSETGSIPGLRPPQIGAVYGVLAHWVVSREPATVVLPTGTGKTETMLVLLAHSLLPRLLVVVPTDALREQTATKFARFGLLKSLNVLETSAEYPVVGTLRKVPSDRNELTRFVRACNVVVTTMGIVNGLTEEMFTHSWNYYRPLSCTCARLTKYL